VDCKSIYEISPVTRLSKPLLLLLVCSSATPIGMRVDDQVRSEVVVGCLVHHQQLAAKEVLE
jgi:hypothetical protein